MRKVKCNKCDYVGDRDEFPTGYDFLQQPYIKECPKCDNRQSPGDASMRMFGGERPFVFLREDAPGKDPLSEVLHSAGEAS